MRLTARASLKNRSTCARSADVSARSILIATRVLTMRCSATNTSPMPPAPSRSTIVKSLIASPIIAPMVTSNRARRRRKILLVDDSALALQITASVLEAASFDVRTSTAIDGLSALLGEWHPDVILTDVEMPGLTGPDLCRALERGYETAYVPVVLFSALPATKLEALARDCEADGFSCKADLDELPQALGA